MAAAQAWAGEYAGQIQLSTQSGEIKTSVDSVYSAFSTEAPNGADKTWSSFATSLVSAATTDEAKQMALVGAAVMAGIDTGAVNYAEGAKAFDSPQALLDFFKREFDIKSPSQVFADQVGKPIGEGILEGISVGLGVLAGAGTGAGVTSPVEQFFTDVLAKTATFKLNLQIAFLNMKTAITGVLDTTNLEWQAKLLEGYELLNADFDAFAVDWVEVRWPTLTEALIGLLDTFKQGAVDKIKEMAEDVLKEVDNLVQALKSDDMIAKWNEAGADIGRALVDGMIDSFGDEKTDEKLKTAGEALINAVVAALKAAGLIDSPSKLTAEEIGAPLAAGVAVGMTGEDAVLRTAGGRMIDYAIAGATDTLRQTTLQAAKPVASMQSNQQAVRGGNVTNEYHLHLTTTPALATQTAYNFAVAEVMFGS